MIKCIFFFFCLSNILIARDSNRPKNNTSSKSIKDTLLIIDSLPSSFSSFPKTSEETLNEKMLIRANGYRWIGFIDDKYEIDLEITQIDSSKDCLVVKGSYSYLKYNISIPLQGSICLNQHRIQLEVLKDGEVDERFEGTISADLKAIKGLWTKKKTNQQLKFRMQSIMTKENTQLFLHALSIGLLGGGAESPTVEDIGIDTKGIYLNNLQVCNISHRFTPGNFMANSWYSSDIRNSNYSTGILLKKMTINKKYIALISNGYSTEEYSEGKNSAVDPEETSAIAYQVWMYQNGQPINIFVEGKSKAELPIYAILQGDHLILIDTKLKKQQKIPIHRVNSY